VRRAGDRETGLWSGGRPPRVNYIIIIVIIRVGTYPASCCDGRGSRDLQRSQGNTPPAPPPIPPNHQHRQPTPPRVIAMSYVSRVHSVNRTIACAHLLRCIPNIINICKYYKSAATVLYLYIDWSSVCAQST